MSNVTITRNGINSIPLEVRQMIWTLSLVPNKPVHVCYSTEMSPLLDSQGKPQAKAVSSPILAPSLLRVSKKFHEEAEQILYSFNIFQFNGSSAIDDLILFLQSMSERAYRSLLQHIIIELSSSSTALALQCPIDFLIGCNSLRSLIITRLPLRNNRIPKSLQTWMSGLRVQTIKFPDLSPENTLDITQVIQGNGEKLTKGQAEKAHEERALKVLRWGEFEFKKYDIKRLHQSHKGYNGEIVWSWSWNVRIY